MGWLSGNRPSYIAVLLLVAATLVVFWPVLGHEFVDYDDHEYITTNDNIKQGLTPQSLRWAFTTTYAANWHPMTWLSHMLDYKLFRLNPQGHHATSLILHLISALFLFAVFRRATGSLWKSWFVAMLFATHPLHVESVAWVSERKDVLSTFFWMLTMLAYIYYVERPGVSRYLMVILAFTLGLLAKPMLVTLPFVLLLLDYWPLGRLNVIREPRPTDSRGSQPSTIDHQPFRRTNTQHRTPSTGSQTSSKIEVKSESNSKRLLVEKLPLFLLALGSSIMTYRAQVAGGAVASLEQFALPVRVANALVAYLRYIGKMLWPADLAPFYPHLGTRLPIWQAAAAAVVLICITVAFLKLGRRHRYLTTGWLWYVGTLVPVIGLVHVGSQSIADRYTYVPLIGLFVAIAWGTQDLISRSLTPETRNLKPRKANSRRSISPSTTLPLAAAVIIALGAVSWRQVGYWHDTVTLFEHAAEVTEGNYVAHTALGVAYAHEDMDDEAVQQYEAALKAKPRHSRAHYNLAITLAKLGRTQDAISHYTEALTITPDDAAAHNNLGILLADAGRYYEAIPHYQAALKASPNDAEAHNNLGSALAGLKHVDRAIAQFTTAIRLKPRFAQAHLNMGTALAMQAKWEGAIDHFRQSLAIAPRNPQAHYNLAIALYNTGSYAEALKEAQLCRKCGGNPSQQVIDVLTRKAIQ